MMRCHHNIGAYITQSSKNVIKIIKQCSMVFFKTRYNFLFIYVFISINKSFLQKIIDLFFFNNF